MSLKHWGLIVAGAGLWWVMGLNLFIYHVVTFLYFMVLVHHYDRGSRAIYLPQSAFWLLGIVIVYATSIGLHSFSAPPSRVVAALYNLSFWVVGFMLVVLLANAYDSRKTNMFFTPFFILCISTAGFFLMALLLMKMGIGNFGFKTPLYPLKRIFGDTVLVTNTLTATLIHRDWFVASFYPRLNIYSPYATATGGCIMICLYMLFTKAAMASSLKSPKIWLLLLLNFGALLMTFSRMPLMAFIACTIFVFFIEKQKTLLWALFGITIVIFALPLLDQAITAFLKMREGSNTSRMDLYVQSINYLKGIDWVLGAGIKPRIVFSSYPIGSHSTYVASLYKMGALGFSLFLLLQVTLVIRWYQVKALASKRKEDFALWRGLGLVMLSMNFWMMTEDIDAPQFLAFLYFSCVGYFEGFRRSLIDE